MNQARATQIKSVLAAISLGLSGGLVGSGCSSGEPPVVTNQAPTSPATNAPSNATTPAVGNASNAVATSNAISEEDQKAANRVSFEKREDLIRRIKELEEDIDIKKREYFELKRQQNDLDRDGTAYANLEKEKEVKDQEIRNLDDRKRDLEFELKHLD